MFGQIKSEMVRSGTGVGNIMIYIYFKLMKNLKIKNEEKEENTS